MKTLKPLWEELGCIIPLENVDIPMNEFIIFKEVKLNIKPEFHVTLFDDDFSLAIHKKCSLKQKDLLVSFLNNFEFIFHLTNQVFFLKKDYGDHIRYSRIVKVDMENQNDFEREFSRIIGFSYSFFPHVTTHSTATIKEKENIGIGIKSLEDIHLYEWK